ncbi:CST complex subunit STN1 [Sphaceloma murrayae]|uniref:CST complex subunit STN1 n=1 Tax=Sphaceloma murrayae TaxID=2082308 RepID=A0A2K1QZ09_9PEZI|nr:CST complex subunit STN1 [Sphaceloma murrayae]
MSNGRVAGYEHAIPPAKYFGASPTYNQWCKLSIADALYRLREAKGFEGKSHHITSSAQSVARFDGHVGQNILFYLNHPIQYAYLVGIIVSIEVTSTGPAIITLDDGTGACIDLVILRDKSSEVFGRTQTDRVTMGSSSGAIGMILDTKTLYLDDDLLQPGLVVKAKGTFSAYRGVRQINLKRLNILKDTAEELAAWEAETKFRTEVLSEPWILSTKQRQSIDAMNKQEEAQLKLEEARADLEKKQRARKLEQHMRKRAKREEEEERQRRKLEAEMDEGALV